MVVLVVLILIALPVALLLPLAIRGRQAAGRTSPGQADTARPLRGYEDMAVAVDEAVERVDRAAQARERELTRRLLAGRLDRITYRSRMNELARGGSTQVGGTG